MTRTIQPQQSGVPFGEYDPHKELPYPFHIDESGDVLRQDFWKGEPSRLIGFQRRADVQRVDLLAAAWVKGEPDAAVGMFPIFLGGGGIYTDLRPIASVHENNNNREDHDA